MSAEEQSLSLGTAVSHPRHGSGRVVADMGATVVVRFGSDLQQVPAAEVVAAPSLDAALLNGELDEPVDAVVRAQALTIASVNDQWGVFSRSRVRLLPHQLWVCRTVNRKWPFRWLVADDVGLGKTIECGLGADAADRIGTRTPVADPGAGKAGGAVAVSPEGHVRHPVAALRSRGGYAARGLLGHSIAGRGIRPYPAQR